MNLVVIRSKDFNKTKNFYFMLGLLFVKEKHEGGPEHYACSVDGFVFEIYPLKEGDVPTTNIRLGFEIDTVDGYIHEIEGFGGVVVTPPYDSSAGRKAVVKDPDGHTIELLCKHGT